MKTEERLRQNILKELQKITAGNSPALYKMMQTKAGYENLEKVIISRVINDNLPPIAIIPQLEMEYGLDDNE